MFVNVCIYEDDVYQQLSVLTTFRPAYDLRLGINRIFDKMLRYFEGSNITLHCRDYLKPYLASCYRGYTINTLNTGLPCLFINGRVVLTDAIMALFEANTEQHTEQHNMLITQKGQIVGMYLKGELLERMQKYFKTTPNNTELITSLRSECVTKEVDFCQMIQYPWDLLSLNSGLIRADFNIENKKGIIKGEMHPFTVLYNENNIFIDQGAVIEDFVVLNAETGPIYIESGVHIQAGSRIEGPVFIGRHSVILGARIKDSTIGPYCKIGGEVSGSIFHQYTNKAHDGFVGNSYVGEWVNLGAGTITSNLKNTYGTISVIQNGTKQSTGLQFLGAIIGDHTKTGIGVLLNTGSMIGCGVNVYGSEIQDRAIPAFSWGCPGQYTRYELESFLTTASRMMNRRRVDLNEHYRTLIEYVYTSSDWFVS